MRVLPIVFAFRRSTIAYIGPAGNHVVCKRNLVPTVAPIFLTRCPGFTDFLFQQADLALVTVHLPGFYPFMNEITPVAGG